MWLVQQEITFHNSSQNQLLLLLHTMQTKLTHLNQRISKIPKLIPNRNVSINLKHSIYIVRNQFIIGFIRISISRTMTIDLNVSNILTNRYFVIIEPPATTTSNNYSSYDAALYSAATMYAVQQTKPNNG